MTSTANAEKNGDWIPVVEVADMQAAWQVYRDAQSKRPCDYIALSDKALAQSCSKAADIAAVGYRLGFLRRLATRSELFRFTTAGQPNPSLIRAFAKVPMAKPKDSPGEGFPFEMRDLLRLCTEP
jgi:hypothetical protein